MQITLDNHDSRIRYYSLMMQRKNVCDIPQFSLPSGYRFVYYQPGDRDAWIEIEKSAKEFLTFQQGIDAWELYYAGHDDELVHRLFFIETDSGEKVATATAYYDVLGNDKTDAGWLHWVAVKREHQGKGLARPLISRTLHRLAELGYAHLLLSTQTCTWVACRIYMEFGFKPLESQLQEDDTGWRIMKTLTDHQTLSELSPLPLEKWLCISNTE